MCLCRKNDSKWQANSELHEISVCTIAAAFKWADFPKEVLVTGM